jgi:adenylate cyclase class 2
MAHEIEIKLRLDDHAGLVERLQGLGATLVEPAQAESNLLFDDGGGTLWSAGSALRLRQAGAVATLTWKGPKRFHRGVRTREEIETRVEDARAIRRVLEALGLRPVLRYDKRRETWRLGDTLVMLDETSAGRFVEIEGQEASVRRLTRSLGLDEEQGLSESYASLVGRSLPPDAEFEWP